MKAGKTGGRAGGSRPWPFDRLDLAAFAASLLLHGLLVWTVTLMPWAGFLRAIGFLPAFAREPSITLFLPEDASPPGEEAAEAGLAPPEPAADLLPPGASPVPDPSGLPAAGHGPDPQVALPEAAPEPRAPGEPQADPPQPPPPQPEAALVPPATQDGALLEARGRRRFRFTLE